MATFSKGLQVNGHVFLSMCIFLRVAPCLIFNDDVLQLLEQKLMYFISPYTLNFQLSSWLFLCYLFFPSMSCVVHNSSNICKKCVKLCNIISSCHFVVGFVVVGLCCYCSRHYNNVCETKLPSLGIFKGSKFIRV
jgi:hypothetical protein